MGGLDPSPARLPAATVEALPQPSPGFALHPSDVSPLRPAARPLWPLLWAQVQQQAREAGLIDGLRLAWVMVATSARRSEAIAPLFALPNFAQHVVADRHSDSLFFISHRHCLSRNWTEWSERLGATLDHYRFEHQHLAGSLLTEVYGPRGAALWQVVQGGRAYRIALTTSPAHRHEGPLSLVCEVDGQRLHEISFAWVAARRLALTDASGLIAFVTRSQSVRFDAPALARFREDFPNNSPNFFCLAALHGLLEALGQQRVAAVRAELQLAYEPGRASSFQHAYDDVWRAFGGVPQGPDALLVPIPTPLAPLASLKSKRRSRARTRRLHWRQIALDTRSALAGRVWPQA
jgi:hypothetical protein